jgi:hypothetical protein
MSNLVFLPDYSNSNVVAESPDTRYNGFTVGPLEGSLWDQPDFTREAFEADLKKIKKQVRTR